MMGSFMDRRVRDISFFLSGLRDPDVFCRFGPSGSVKVG